MLQATEYLASPDAATIGAALARLAGAHAGATVLAFVPESESAAVPRLQAACRDAGIMLYGAVFPQIIADGRLTSRGLILALPQPVAYAALWPEVGDGESASRHCEEFLVDAADSLNGDASLTLLMLFDGMLPNIGTLLDDLYLRLADRVGYVGANAGSETFQPTPCLFDRQRLLGNAALALVFKSPGTPLLEHGYRLPENQITATSTSGNRIAQIDWQPAFQVYQRVVREQYGVDITPENFYSYGVHFPFGIILANGEIIVRIPVQITEDGSIYCVGEIPANSLLTLLQASDEADGHTARRLGEQLASHPAVLTRPTLAFYCAGRRLHLGQEKAQAELAQLADGGAQRSLWGALSLGEIGCPANTTYPLFHNATIVVVPPAP